LNSAFIPSKVAEAAVEYAQVAIKNIANFLTVVHLCSGVFSVMGATLLHSGFALIGRESYTCDV
jgi:hypothetical protein